MQMKTSLCKLFTHLSTINNPHTNQLLFNSLVKVHIHHHVLRAKQVITFQLSPSSNCLNYCFFLQQTQGESFTMTTLCFYYVFLTLVESYTLTHFTKIPLSCSFFPQFIKQVYTPATTAVSECILMRQFCKVVF